MAVVGVLGVGLLAPAGAVAVSETEATEDVIVHLNEWVDAAAVAAELGGRAGEVTAVFEQAANGFAAEVPRSALADLQADPRVSVVEPDHPIVAFQTAPPTGVRRIGAHEHPGVGINGDGSLMDVDVAVLDTGIDGGHPDLRVSGGVDCLSGTCTTVTASDPNGHGTHVAGTIGARDDGVGVVGVAPGARLHSVRVLGANGEGNLSALLAGLDWVRANADRIEVANLSLGCECNSTTLNNAVRNVVAAGVTVVVAAGNAGRDAGTFAPANHPDVVTVAAMTDFDGLPGGRATSSCIRDYDDTFASYSNDGAVVDLVAPGSCILSTATGGGYARSSGTSMAAPHVAGAAAMHIATSGLTTPTGRPAAVRRALLERYSVPATHACGYIGSASSAPMLHLTCVRANTLPVLQVNSPADGASIVAGGQVALRAEADDAEDGRLDAAIVWSSSLEGRLGTGPSLDVTLSTVGDHTITASVTDSSGATARLSRLVRVTAPPGTPPPPPPDDEPSVPEEPEPDAAPATDTRPQLTIVAPVIDGRLVANRDALLVSRAIDREDGDVRAWVNWRSDRDGELGAGGTIGVQLSAGTHRITASVTDTDGNQTERTSVVIAAAVEQLGSRSIDRACPPGSPRGAFGDVDPSGSHARAIDCIAWWEVSRGTGDGAYQPTHPVTRAQMATFLAEMIRRSGGSLPAASRDHFTDTGGSAHEDNINRLAEAGIVRGTGGGRYSPNATVTREQMASFLARSYEHRAALDLPGMQDRFTDVAGSVHEPNINAVAAAGITGGVQPTRYDPASPVRRDQMASFIARTLDVLVSQGVTSPPG